MCLFNANYERTAVASRQFARFYKKFAETYEKLFRANLRLTTQKKIPQLVRITLPQETLKTQEKIVELVYVPEFAQETVKAVKTEVVYEVPQQEEKQIELVYVPEVVQETVKAEEKVYVRELAQDNVKYIGSNKLYVQVTEKKSLLLKVEIYDKVTRVVVYNAKTEHVRIVHYIPNDIYMSELYEDIKYLVTIIENMYEGKQKNYKELVAVKLTNMIYSGRPIYYF